MSIPRQEGLPTGRERRSLPCLGPSRHSDRAAFLYHQSLRGGSPLLKCACVALLLAHLSGKWYTTNSMVLTTHSETLRVCLVHLLLDHQLGQ